MGRRTNISQEARQFFERLKPDKKTREFWKTYRKYTSVAERYGLIDSKREIDLSMIGELCFRVRGEKVLFRLYSYNPDKIQLIQRVIENQILVDEATRSMYCALATKYVNSLKARVGKRKGDLSREDWEEISVYTRYVVMCLLRYGKISCGKILNLKPEYNWIISGQYILERYRNNILNWICDQFPQFDFPKAYNQLDVYIYEQINEEKFGRYIQNCLQKQEEQEDDESGIDWDIVLDSSDVLRLKSSQVSLEDLIVEKEKQAKESTKDFSKMVVQI